MTLVGDDTARGSVIVTLTVYEHPGSNDSSDATVRLLNRRNGGVLHDEDTTDHWYCSNDLPEYGSTAGGPTLAALVFTRTDGCDGPLYGIANGNTTDVASLYTPTNASAGSDTVTAPTPLFDTTHANDGVPDDEAYPAGVLVGVIDSDGGDTVK